MNAFLRMIAEKEKELGVTFATSCKEALSSKTPSQIAKWLWEPAGWCRLQIALDGEKVSEEMLGAIAIGSDIGGNIYCMVPGKNSQHQLDDEVYYVNHELLELKSVGDSLLAPDREKALLKKANELLKSKSK